MLTEDKLPLFVRSLDYAAGTAEVVVRTEIKRDGEVIHTICDHQVIPIGDITDALVPLSEAIDGALVKKAEAEKLAAAEIAQDAVI